jgi:hypothetical protein
MELSESAKAAARRLGDAINSAIGDSSDVVNAIEHLRSLGYEPHLNLKLEIALAKSEEPGDDFELELTADDIRTLERMKIKIDD